MPLLMSRHINTVNNKKTDFTNLSKCLKAFKLGLIYKDAICIIVIRVHK